MESNSSSGDAPLGRFWALICPIILFILTFAIMHTNYLLID